MIELAGLGALPFATLKLADMGGGRDQTDAVLGQFGFAGEEIKSLRDIGAVA